MTHRSWSTLTSFALLSGIGLLAPLCLSLVLEWVGAQQGHLPRPDLASSFNGVTTASVPYKVPYQSSKSRRLETCGKPSLRFEINQGQAESQVKFLSRGNGFNLFLTSTEALMVLSLSQGNYSAAGHRASTKQQETGNTSRVLLRMKLVRANPAPKVMGLEELAGKVNYLIGNDRTKWRTNIQTYAKVKYQDVYPGVDVVYYGNQGQLEHDFVLAPGADPKIITLGFEGADTLEVDAQGDLVIHAAGGQVRQHRPVVYQEAAGVRQEITGSYVLKDDHHVGFLLAPYDSARPLVIDPVLIYSTYFGGSGDDFGTGIAVDAAGNAYLTGWTDSPNFPTTLNALQTVLNGGPSDKLNSLHSDAFVAKISPGGDLVYSTFLGGRDDEVEVVSIAVDPAGNAYVAGITTSTDFPTSAGSFQTVFGGDNDLFVTKLSSGGDRLVYSTYLGGTRGDFGAGIALDADGNVYLTGWTYSLDFPTTLNAVQTVHHGSIDTFVAKLNVSGSKLIYSTYLGGSGADPGGGIALDSARNAYVTGITTSTDFPTTVGAFQTVFKGDSDAYVAKLSPGGDALVYSSYLGGISLEEARGIAVDSNGNAYVTGSTASTDFPTTVGALQTVLKGGNDLFLTKLNPTGSMLIFSTYLGGSGADLCRHIALDATGNAYLTGATTSLDFPTTRDAVQTVHQGGEDAFLTKVNPDGNTLLYSTFLGGTGNDRARGLAVDSLGNAYLVGFTGSTDFPTVSPIQAAFGGGTGPCFFSGGCDAFIAKISSITSDRSTFTTIDVPGAFFTEPRSINSDGKIVGFFKDAIGTHGFLLSGNLFTTIDVPSSSYTQAFGVNDAGQIVGTFANASGTHGFLLNGNIFSPIDVPGATDTRAIGINTAGRIVGTFNNERGTHGFLLGESLTVIDAPTASFTEPRSVNSSGQIVGVFMDAKRYFGFLWSRGNFTIIDVPGSSFVEATGINTAGWIVGAFGIGGGTHGFLLSGENFTRIHVPDSSDTAAIGINDAGQIVGTFNHASMVATNGFLLKVNK